MILIALMFLLLVAAVGGLVGFLALAALKGLFGVSSPPPQRYVFRFNQAPGPNTVHHIPPNTQIAAATTCPFCKRPARAVATSETIRIECRDCGVLDGTADIPGYGAYSIPVL